MHRLQRFSDLVLNPMERSETMSILFYALNYPREVGFEVVRSLEECLNVW